MTLLQSQPLRPQPGVQRQIGNRYYPQHKDPRLNEDFRLAYDHIYQMQDHIEQLTSKLGETNGKLADAHDRLRKMEQKPEPGGPSTTKIAGLFVQGVPPKDGQQLTFNAATAQIEWQ